MKKSCWSLAVAALALMAGAAGASAQGTDGATLYAKNCKRCHGPAGGEPSAAMKARMDPPALFSAAYLAKIDDAKFMASMEKGGQKMKSLSDKMTKEEMKSVMKYVRDYVKNGGK